MQHSIEKINFKRKNYIKEQPSEANYLFTIEKFYVSYTEKLHILTENTCDESKFLFFNFGCEYFKFDKYVHGNFCHKAATYNKILKKYPASVKLQHPISTQGKLQKLNKHLRLPRVFIQYTPLATRRCLFKKCDVIRKLIVIFQKN